MTVTGWRHRWRRMRRVFSRRPRLALYYHEAYRLPLPVLESAVGFDTRRADLVAWHLFDTRVLPPSARRTPERVRYSDLARVHPFEWIAQLDNPERMARVFQLEAFDVPVREVLHTMRLACGGTLMAAREVRATGGVALNLLGGFHHAAPTRGAGLCLFNDIAVAIAVLRAEGFRGRVVVLDFDAHPPDGTAECLALDADAWIGSLSGSDWGPLFNVDETVLPQGCPDDAYLEALDALLARMPRPDLAFVVAGSDVLGHDRLGLLGLTLDGARRRDLRVARALEGVPSVWLPAGGYHRDSWRVVAGTALVLARGSLAPIPPGADPLAGRFARIALGLDDKALGRDLDLSHDLEISLGLGPPPAPRLLDFYTVEGLELVFERYGVLGALRRLGYSKMAAEIEPTENGDFFRLRGDARGKRHLLIECGVSRRSLGDVSVVFVNWLTLRHPAAHFTASRPRLPNQDAPGLGLLAEMANILALMAQRLGLAGVAFRPAHYHVAYVARSQCRFLQPRDEGRFLALGRDLGRLPLPELSAAIDAGRVLCNGRPYAWEPTEMVLFLKEPEWLDAYNEAVEAERNGVRFRLA